ncbi:hypothetical protein [Parvibaculum sp.]|uniref:hypothetical protein n=1 Tax=Parvibaculum sp. TaxID=2024848 RepID=UPI001E0090A5|nr:hypothetical protein [Parvibaculum sp.]MBX3490256.1 hypothetical protein [Parvibaculum sp.]
MTRIFALAVWVAFWAAAGGTAQAACEAGGLLATCPDDFAYERPGGTEEAYQRLDGGGFGGPPAGGAQQFSIGDTTVTLGQSETNEQPWNAFNRKTGDATDFKREDEARSGDLNPLNKVCGADGCR